MKFTQDKIVTKNLSTKTIQKFTPPDKYMEINHMTLNGRHPADPNHYIYEVGVPFMVYVIAGTGKMWCGEEVYEMQVGDVAYIHRATKFAAEGKGFEYLTFEAPAWYAELAFVVDKDGKIVEATNN